VYHSQDIVISDRSFVSSHALLVATKPRLAMLADPTRFAKFGLLSAAYSAAKSLAIARRTAKSRMSFAGARPGSRLHGRGQARPQARSDTVLTYEAGVAAPYRPHDIKRACADIMSLHPPCHAERNPIIRTRACLRSIHVCKRSILTPAFSGAF